jgi:hypothetical protein
MEVNLPGKLAWMTCAARRPSHRGEADDAYALGEDEDDREDGHLHGEGIFQKKKAVLLPPEKASRAGDCLAAKSVRLLRES